MRFVLKAEAPSEEVPPMAKTKRMHLGTIAEERKNESPKGRTDTAVVKEAVALIDPLITGEEWIEVRKQRIIIIIPSLPRTRQNLRGFGQERKRKAAQASVNTKEVASTCFKKRRFKRADQTDINTISPQEVSVQCNVANMIKKMQSCNEANIGSLAFNEGANNSQAMIESNVPFNANNMKLRPRGRKRDRALSISYNFKRARRHRRLENHVPVQHFKKTVPSTLTEDPFACKQIVDSKTKVEHENSNSNEKYKIQDLNNSVVKETLNKLTQYEQVEGPEVAKIAPFPLPGNDFTWLQQSTSTIQKSSKPGHFRAENDHISYKNATVFSLRSCKNVSNMLTNPGSKAEATKAPLSRLKSDSVVPSKDTAYDSPIEQVHLMSSAFSLRSDDLISPHDCCQMSLTNKAIRAYTLKKQLEKAGGLKRWLLSLRLEQFIQAFEKKKFDEVDLIHLTMSDLKSMGTKAVGPRRKLMWAINCLSQNLTL